MSYPGINGNNDFIKKLNMENVFSTILFHKPISRAKIAALTGLNKVTVSTCVDFFLKQGIIYELGTTETSRGRPPTLIELNAEAGICVGIEVEYNEYKILVSDATGQPLGHTTKILEDVSPKFFVDSVAQELAGLPSKYHQYRLGILGVGIAMPGHYNAQTGVVEYIASLKSWNQFPLLSELNKAVPSVPFFIESSLNAGAMSESYSRRPQVPGVLVYVGGLWGLGVGITINGKAFPGNLGFAGRLGHSTIQMDGKLCRCGNRGCWELYGSARALRESLYPNDEPNSHPFEDIAERLRNRDPEVIQAVRKLGHYHGIGLANVINAYNPNVITIGGYLGLLGSPFIESVNETLAEILPQRFLREMTIDCSEYGELGGAQGAVSMVIHNLSSTLVNRYLS